MGRLDDIVQRNQNKGRPRERIVVMFGFGIFLLIVIGMLLFTDLGLPREPPAPPRRVDDVLLRAAPVRDAR